jgi:hypothetical protein
MITSEELLEYVKERIATLTELREEMHAEGNHASDDYTAGAIDSYDIMRIKLEGQTKFL